MDLKKLILDKEKTFLPKNFACLLNKQLKGWGSKKSQGFEDDE